MMRDNCRSAFSQHMRIIALLFSLLMPLLAQAHDTTKLSKLYSACMGKSGGVTSAMLECNSREWTRQDKRLNAAYQQLMTQLPASKGKELQEVQRAWLQYADAKCAFYVDDQEFSGSAHMLIAAGCNTTERAKRAEELENLIEQAKLF